MYIQPSSTIELFTQSPLDSRYINTIYFSTRKEQNDYFQAGQWGGQKITLNEYSYARNTRDYIQINLPMNRVYNVNYMRFKNTDYEDKWFYGFVNKVEYVNDTTTRLHWELDVMQTWLADVDYKLTSCYVEREHSATDEIGDNLIDENLGISDYKFSNKREDISNYDLTSYDELSSHIPYYLVVAVTKLGDGDIRGLHYIDETVTATSLVIFDVNTQGGDLQYFLASYDSHPEQITNIYMLPNDTINLNDTTITSITVTIKVDGIEDIQTTMSVRVLNNFTNGRNNNWFTNIYCGTEIDGYTVMNKKLLTYPYNFLTIYTNEGDNSVFRFEFFNGTTGAVFQIQDKILPPYKVVCRPKDYKGWSGATWNLEISKEIPFIGAGLTIDNTPVCDWSHDNYRAWLETQGVYKIAQGTLSTVASVGGLVASVATGNVATGIASGGALLSNIISQLQEFNLAKTHDVGGEGSLNSSSLDYTHRLLGFYAIRTFITKEWAMKLDEFFSMYGYATRSIKIPNIAVRRYWTYTKTNGCSVKSVNAPNDDITKINTIFDNGIRFFNKFEPFTDCMAFAENNTPL